MNLRRVLRVIAGLLGLACLAAVVVNFDMLLLAWPVAVVALALLWASATVDSGSNAGAGDVATNISAIEETPDVGGAGDGWGVTVLVVLGTVVALLVLCSYGLYVATYLL